MIERFVKFVGAAMPARWRIFRKAALAAGIIGVVAAAGVVHAQQTPPQQAPQTQPPQAPDAQKPAASQDNQEVDELPARRVKPHEYKNWTFNAGGGGNLPHGTTNEFVKGGGLAANGGVTRNFDKYFGLQLGFSWTDLPLRESSLQMAQASGASNHVYGLTFDPVVYIPFDKTYTGYVLIGPGFYHRSGKLDSSTALPGSVCNSFWDWWGVCRNGSIPLSGNYLKESLNQFGFNYGGGLSRKVTDKIDLYAEYRAQHASWNNNTTDARTVTVGVRW